METSGTVEASADGANDPVDFDKHNCRVFGCDDHCVEVHTNLIEKHFHSLIFEVKTDESFTEARRHYIVHTSVPTTILKELFFIAECESIRVEDWPLLEVILDQARKWEVRIVVARILQKFIAEVDDVNCIGVWKKCEEFHHVDTDKVFNYVLYVILESVLARRNIDFYRLDADDVVAILASDLLNVTSEVDVWEVVKLWMQIDIQKRATELPSLMECVRFSQFTAEEAKNFKLEAAESSWKDIRVNWNRAEKPRIARDLLLTVGGWHDGKPSNIVEAFDLKRNVWRRVPFMEKELRIAYHACVVIKNKLFIVGGFDGTKYFNRVRCFDGETKCWQELSPMNRPRAYVAACELDGKVLAAGGADGSSRHRAAELYDVDSNQWKLICRMNRRRSDASACCLNDRVYVAGGYNGHEVLASVEMYNPTTDVWTEVAMMNEPRSGLGCVAYGDNILIVGGFDGFNRLDTVEMLKVGSAHPVRVASLPGPRSNFALAELNGRVYAAGGISTTNQPNSTTDPLKEVLRFDGQTWTAVSSMETARSALNAVVIKGWPNPESYLAGETQPSEKPLGITPTTPTTPSQQKRPSGPLRLI